MSSGGDGTVRVWDVQTGEPVWTGWMLPEGNTASIGGNRFLWGSPEAWRWLGWRVQEQGQTRLLPCETFGPVPGISGRG